MGQRLPEGGGFCLMYFASCTIFGRQVPIPCNPLLRRSICGLEWAKAAKTSVNESNLHIFLISAQGGWKDPF
jgi:hypothetical protein